MTRTSEMEHNPDPREVDSVLFQLEKPARTEYSTEIERRALELLKTRSHNEWRARVEAEAELAYVQKANAWMVLVCAVLVLGIALMVKR